MSPIVNIILFGESGSGKSSIVNMLAGSPLAEISSSVNGCTFAAQSYSVVDIRENAYNIHDTAGLDEGTLGTVPKQDALVKLYSLLKALDSGINLLIFCMRGPRIKDGTHKNWYLFHKIICRRQLPIILAVTGLENEINMDDWWLTNKHSFQEYRMIPNGVACITATRGRRLKSGQYKLDEEYEESKQKLWKLIMEHSLESPWVIPPVEWFRDIANITYETRWCRDPQEHTQIEQVIGSATRDLVSQCEMTEEDAKNLATEFSKVEI